MHMLYRAVIILTRTTHNAQHGDCFETAMITIAVNGDTKSNARVSRDCVVAKTII